MRGRDTIMLVAEATILGMSRPLSFYWRLISSSIYSANVTVPIAKLQQSTIGHSRVGEKSQALLSPEGDKIILDSSPQISYSL